MKITATALLIKCVPPVPKPREHLGARLINLTGFFVRQKYDIIIFTISNQNDPDTKLRYWIEKTDWHSKALQGVKTLVGLLNRFSPIPIFLSS